MKHFCRRKYGLLWYIYLVVSNRSVSGGWVDADTPENVTQTISLVDGKDYFLVMSDEFEKSGRSFEDGQDPKWTSINRNDYTNAALHYYSNDMVYTEDGMLVIKSVNEDVTFKYWEQAVKGFRPMKKNYITGMLQGWDKFCISSGIIEVSASLPGDVSIGGLWPAIWLLGNLARATYTSSSDFQWPWSYDKCVRTNKEHKEYQYQQEISACNMLNHYGMHSYEGRGAPEIDVFEAMAGYDPYSPFMVGKPYISLSYQVAPGTAYNRPTLGKYPRPGQWYDKGLGYGSNTTANTYFYGTKLKHEPLVRSYWADAISANHGLQPTHFGDQHVYRLEWVNGESGYLKWYLDGEFMFSMSQDTLNRTGSKIADEPMYLILNTAISSMWGFPSPCPTQKCACDCWDARDSKCTCAIPAHMADIFPAHFKIDWVRVYQDPTDPRQRVGCDTPEMPTEKWIKGHADLYVDPGEKIYKRPVPQGGGVCHFDSECGGGACSSGKCVCPMAWSGPTCKAPNGFDDTPRPKQIIIPPMVRPEIPYSLAAVFLALGAIFLSAACVRARHRIQRHKYAVLGDSGITVLPFPKMDLSGVGSPSDSPQLSPRPAGGFEVDKNSVAMDYYDYES